VHSEQGKPGNYELHLVVDVPSTTSGTGTMLLLDGQDTALVRASVMEKVTLNDANASGALVGSYGYALVSSRQYMPLVA
jgi:hypothetical protein